MPSDHFFEHILLRIFLCNKMALLPSSILSKTNHTYWHIFEENIIIAITFYIVLLYFVFFLDYLLIQEMIREFLKFYFKSCDKHL